MRKDYKVRNKVEIFKVENPWVYIAIPKTITNETKDKADRGLVAIKAKTGKSSWDTSLMPMGDGTQFIPLPAKIRKAENISIGDMIEVSFRLRKR